MIRAIYGFLIISAVHGVSIQEGLRELKEAPYGFAMVDVDFSLENFSSIDIQRDGVYHHFGEDNIEESMAHFFSEIGHNEEALRTAISIKEIIRKVLEASRKETGWICLRAFIPTTRFDIPRWHVDGPYYAPDEPEDLLFKFVLTLRGPTTLFYPLSPELRKITEKGIHNRQYMKAVCKEENIISPQIGEGAVFIAGLFTAVTALHSEPPIHEHRLFLSIVPCTETQLLALKRRVSSLYPKELQN